MVDDDVLSRQQIKGGLIVNRICGTDDRGIVEDRVTSWAQRVRVVAAILLFAFILAVLAMKAGGGDDLPAVTSCVEETYTHDVSVDSVCSESFDRVVCDAANISCYNGIDTISYPCAVIETRDSVRQSCSIVGYDADTRRITGDGVRCSYESRVDPVVVVCDSIYDGNGDGECASGESCARIIIDGDDTTVSLKNSRDNYVIEDDTFMLGDMVTEATA